MKLTQFLRFALTFLMLFGIVSCKNDDSLDEIYTPKGNYENGILISNEGNFGTPNAEVSFIGSTFSDIENDVFKTNNNNNNLGDVLQFIGFEGDRAYMVLNNSNKIVVANRYTMQKITEITTELVSPRYVDFAGNYIYITNDAYGGDKYVAIYNKADYSFVSKISFTNAAERLVTAGGNLFVQNASFGYGNEISMIDTATNSLSTTITIPNGQINKIIESNDQVYAITTNGTDSFIYQISSTGTISNTITLAGLSNANHLDIENDFFYFTDANNVYKMAKTAISTPTNPLFSVIDNGFSTLYAFEVIGDRIFISDAKGFTQQSEVSVYSTDGVLSTTFNAGISSNGFYENN